MPGVAAIVNKAVSGDKSIQLFYNTEELNLGVVLKSGDDSDDPDKNYAAKSTDRKGIIPNPSQIDAKEFLGINLVVGITQPTLPESGTYSTYNVSIISPVYRPLAKTEKTNVSIALCSTGKSAYVYYLGGTDASNISLHEYRIDTLGGQLITGTTGILKGTALAAYCIGNDRYVIYQGSSGTDLHEYRVGKGDSDIDNTTGARSGTAIAVTIVGKKVYLYYTDGKYRLRKIVKDNGEWGSSQGISGTDSVDESSHLTVTTSNGVNNIFYVQAGEASTNFSHVRDAI